MKQKTEQEELIVRYFFGELSEEERRHVEERFLIDNHFFEQMLCVEDALIDAYAQGQLSDQELKKVEENFLSDSERNREVKFIKDLIGDLAGIEIKNTDHKVSSPEKSQSRWRALLTILGLDNIVKTPYFALALAVIIFGLGIIIWNLILQNKLSQMEHRQTLIEQRERELAQQINLQHDKSKELNDKVEADRNAHSQIEEEIASIRELNSPQSSTSLAMVFLDASAISRSGGELKLVQLHPYTKRVQIKLDIAAPENCTSYSIVIRNFDGQEIWNRTYPKTDRNDSRITIILPAEKFANSEYTLTLKAHDGNSEILNRDYSFRIKGLRPVSRQ